MIYIFVHLNPFSIYSITLGFALEVLWRRGIAVTINIRPWSTKKVETMAIPKDVVL